MYTDIYIFILYYVNQGRAAVAKRHMSKSDDDSQKRNQAVTHDQHTRTMRITIFVRSGPRVTHRPSAPGQ